MNFIALTRETIILALSLWYIAESIPIIAIKVIRSEGYYTDYLVLTSTSASINQIGVTNMAVFKEWHRFLVTAENT